MLTIWWCPCIDPIILMGETSSLTATPQSVPVCRGWRPPESLWMMLVPLARQFSSPGDTGSRWYLGTYSQAPTSLSLFSLFQSLLWQFCHLYFILCSPKRNQPWIFIGRTDAEAETPVLWPPDFSNELIHWKRPWCWERLKVGGEGGDLGWDGWMGSLTRWTWVWASSRRQ